MGIRTETIGLIERAVEELGGYEGLTMCELGNQQIRGMRQASAKSYFKKKGVVHVSIDENGLDGALPYDLSQEISGLGQFDLVTNYGTSEHVPDQYHVFRNIHNLTRHGGIMVHAVPMFGYWDHHGLVGYDEGFLRLLAAAHGYQVYVETQIERALEDDNKRLLVCGVLGKTDAPFISRESFSRLGGIHEYA